MRKFILLFFAIFFILFLTSCPNLLNKPLEKPHSPTPENGADNQPLNVELSWECSDPDSDDLSYDIYYGKGKLDSITFDVKQSSYLLKDLDGNSEYLWKVIAKDENNNTSQSDTWSFTTTTPNQPPTKPSNPNPEDEAENQLKEITLSWECTDPDNDVITYDIYFGKDSLEPSVTNYTKNEYTLNNLDGHTTYKWKIIAKDTKDNTTESDVWSFTTINSDPTKPYNPEPTNNATNVSTDTVLSWECSDPDGDSLVYDIFLGTSKYPPLIESDYPATSFVYPDFQDNETYFWKIKAKDEYDGKNTGEVWAFTVQDTNKPPKQPSNPIPIDNSKDISTKLTLRWECVDPDNDALSYDVFFGTTEYPPLIVSDCLQNSLDIDKLESGTTYYWKIKAKDEKGQESVSPIWTFKTVPFEEDFESGDFSSHPWITNGEIKPFVQSKEVYEGNYSVEFQGGTTEIEKRSKLEIEVTLSEASVISFYKKLDNKSYGFESLLWFEIDGNLAGIWMGETSWNRVLREVSAGKHTITWNMFSPKPEHKVWLDKITILNEADLGKEIAVPDEKLKTEILAYLGKYPVSFPPNTVTFDKNNFTKLFKNLRISPKEKRTLKEVEDIAIYEKELVDFSIFIPLVTDRVFSDINGIQHMKNLKVLELSSPYYYQGDQNIHFGEIKDISPIGNLTSLEYLFIDNNQISDITSLNKLTELTYVSLNDNKIKNLTALENLNKLELLLLDNNQIEDIQPLVDNTGFDKDDRINIRENYLDLTTGSEDMVNIQKLLDRGVEVLYEPQKEKPLAPEEPANPVPTNGATNVQTNVSLSWQCEDPNTGDSLEYDIYFGTNTNLPLIAENTPYNKLDITNLDHDTIYYWKVLARDSNGMETEGPVWSFITTGIHYSMKINIIGEGKVFIEINNETISTEESTTISHEAATVTLAPISINNNYIFGNWDIDKNHDIIADDVAIFYLDEDVNATATFELKEYDITLSTSPEDGGIVSGGGTFKHGQEVTVVATPNEDYKFNSWTDSEDNTVFTNPTYTFTATEDKHLVANFDKKTYILTIDRIGEGETEPDIGIYGEDKEDPWNETLIATPSGDYLFKGWKLSNEEDIRGATTTFVTVDEDITATAIFELPEYNISVSATPTEAGTVSGGGIYELHSEVIVIATPNNENWQFDAWYEDDSVISTENSLTFNATEDRDLVAHFKSTILTINSTPLTEIPILVNGKEVMTPYSTSVNSDKSIEVSPSPSFTLNLFNEEDIEYGHFGAQDDASLTFVKWSDNNSNPTRIFNEENNGTYTLEYDVEFLLKTGTWKSIVYIDRDATDVNFPEYGWYKYGTAITLDVPKETYLKDDDETPVEFNSWEINGIKDTDNRTTKLDVMFNEPKFITAIYSACAAK